MTSIQTLEKLAKNPNYKMSPKQLVELERYRRQQNPSPRKDGVVRHSTGVALHDSSIPKEDNSTPKKKKKRY